MSFCWFCHATAQIFSDLQFKLIMSQREQQQQAGNASASSKHSKNGKDNRGLEKGKTLEEHFQNCSFKF